MKKVSAFILTLFVCFIDAKSQQVAFRTTYPNVTISSVSQAADHGYIVAGYSTTYSIGSKDIVLIKTDSMGAVTWTQTFGNKVNANADDIAANAVEIPGGGYYLAGQFWNQVNNTYEVYALKTDANGNRLWSKTMNNGGYDKGMRVENAAAGGCMVTGWVGNSSRGYLGWIDASGNVIWQVAINYALGSWNLQSARQTPDGGMINCGYDNELGAYEMWLVKTSAAGAIQWQKGYAMSATFNFSYDVCTTADSGYMLAGGSTGINVAKTDGSGNLQWAKTYLNISASTTRAYSVRQCQDNGYIFLANDLNNNQYLMKTDSTGNVSWTRQYTGGYYINTVEQTADGGYVLAMGSDLIKTDANGVTGCGEVPFAFTASVLTLATRTPSASTTPLSLNAVAADSSTSPSVVPTICFPTEVGSNEEQSSFMVFPNPATTELRIKNSELKIKKIEIYSILGEKVYSQQPKTGNTDASVSIFDPKPVTVNVSGLPSGLYFVKVLTENGFAAGKFVKQ
jgi:hypothetical protein